MSLIQTMEAKCRDCYRCLRACPVQAIRFRRDDETGNEIHATVLEERCILDGRCVLECPQNAKRVRSDVDCVQQLLTGDKPVVASIAPSFWAAWPTDPPSRLVGLLLQLGFDKVEETAVGAALVARAHGRLHEGESDVTRPQITASCPVVVSMVEKHQPEVIDHLEPLVSPMLAHARYLRGKYGEIEVVFIGPCIAKKEEAEWKGRGDVSCVLTFRELWDWAQDQGLDPEAATIGEFSGSHPGAARLYPAEGGFFRTAQLGTDMLDQRHLAVTGVEECMSFLHHLAKGDYPQVDVVEMMACRGGCLGGPMAVERDDAFSQRQRLLDHYHRDGGEQELEEVLGLDLDARYSNRKLVEAEPNEEEVREILAMTGKYTVEDEYNCGACGYDSCREKAIAVFQERAEVDMCIPYMRRKAESFSNLVMSSLPSAVLIVNSKLHIVEANPAAESLLGDAADIIGSPVANWFDDTPYRQALESNQPAMMQVRSPRDDMVTEQIIFQLKEHSLLVAIINDVTAEDERREKVQRLKGETIEKANQVITKQMKVVQEIAGLLGETTAETKVLLQKLIDVMREE